MDTLHPDRTAYTKNVPRYGAEEIRNGLSLFKYISGNAVMVGDPNLGKSEAQLALHSPGSNVTSLSTQFEMLQLDKDAFSHTNTLPVAVEEETPFRFGVEPNDSISNTFMGRYRPRPTDVYDETTTNLLNALNIEQGSIVRFNFGFKAKSGLDESRHSRNKLFEENTAEFVVETPKATFTIKFTGVLGSMSMQVMERHPATPEFEVGDTVMRGIIFNSQEGPVENTGTQMTPYAEVFDTEASKAVTNVAFALVRNTLFEKHTIVVSSPEDRREVR